jgi:SIR2-like domain
MTKTIHNPDSYMSDLRQILAQGRKRLGLLVGAGAPASVCIDKQTGRIAPDGEPLIPATAELTKRVRAVLDATHGPVINAVAAEIGGNPNIEMILSRIRSLADALGNWTAKDLDGAAYRKVEEAICSEIGKAVRAPLPKEDNPFSELAGWIGGTARDHAFEIFTPNYDLLFEEAFERARIPYFDGFCGSNEPFFDSATIANGDLPARWARLWKLHGSLGWDLNSQGEIVRRQDKAATRLIYPTHLKYDQTQKLPYAALFERLRNFLRTPDSLLLTCGFSFSDSHLLAIMDEALSANRAATVLAFQFGQLAYESAAHEIASHRANFSVYASDGAVINCVKAIWEPGEIPHPAWAPIRASYWGAKSPDAQPAFLLGGFRAFARYIALTRTEQGLTPETVPSAVQTK